MKLLLLISLAIGIIACNNSDSKENKETKQDETAQPASKQVVFDKLVGTWQSEDGKSSSVCVEHGDAA